MLRDPTLGGSAVVIAANLDHSHNNERDADDSKGDSEPCLDAHAPGVHSDPTERKESTAKQHQDPSTRIALPRIATTLRQLSAWSRMVRARSARARGTVVSTGTRSAAACTRSTDISAVSKKMEGRHEASCGGRAGCPHAEAGHDQHDLDGARADRRRTTPPTTSPSSSARAPLRASHRPGSRACSWRGPPVSASSTNAGYVSCTPATQSNPSAGARCSKREPACRPRPAHQLRLDRQGELDQDR